MKTNTQFRTRFADDRGNVTPTFALMAIPLFAFVGGAIDFGRAYSAHLEMQAALDAAILSAADTYRLTGDTTKAEETARTLLEQTFTTNGFQLSPAGSVPPATAEERRTRLGNSNDFTFNFREPDPDNGLIAAELAQKVKTPFLSMAGLEELTVRAASNAILSGNTIEVGLVLDITGSMQGDKLEEMKGAAKDFLDLVMPDGLPDGKSKVALVPFADHVNVGRTFYNRVATSSTRYSGTPGDDKRTCVRERNSSSYRYTDAAPTNLFNGYPQKKTVEQCTGSGSNRSCINVQVTNDDCQTKQTIVPLSSDKASLKAKIDLLEARGSTAGHLGTAWGWNMVSPNWSSFWPTGSQPVPYETKNHVKVVVIMTDGEYNKKYTGSGSNTQAVSTCNNMKQQITDEMGRRKAKVEVYTIGFGVGDNNTARTTLQNCATSSTHYFFPYDGETLRAAFHSIGTQIGTSALGARIAGQDEVEELLR